MKIIKISSNLFSILFLIACAYAVPIAINPPQQIYCITTGPNFFDAKCVWNSTDLLWEKANWSYDHYKIWNATYFFVGSQYATDNNGDPIADLAIYRRRDRHGDMTGDDYVVLGLIGTNYLVPYTNSPGSKWITSNNGRLGKHCGWYGRTPVPIPYRPAAPVEQCQWTPNPKNLVA